MNVKDWPWFWITVFLAVAAPFFGSLLVYGIDLLSRKKGTKLEWAAPYRDGQLGYVVVGWCAAALLEVYQVTDKVQNLHDANLIDPVKYGQIEAFISSWEFAYVIGCCMIGALGALVAALGAANPVPEQPDPDEAKYITYLSALVSVGLSVIGFYVVNRVHSFVLTIVI
jgi:hypothetical protein